MTKTYHIDFGIIGDIAVKAPSQAAAIRYAQKQMTARCPKATQDVKTYRVTVRIDKTDAE
tara:strand:+ start:689 stop:868 length:180 start_codon:yes stop_codon:yes gene_type:complete